MWHTEHWTAVSTLLGLINSAHRVFHRWRSNQQPQYAEAETLPLGHWFMPHITDAELTSHGKLRDHFDLMCLEGYVFPTEDTATSGATSSQVGVTSPHNISIMDRIYNYIILNGGIDVILELPVNPPNK